MRQVGQPDPLPLTHGGLDFASIELETPFSGERDRRADERVAIQDRTQSRDEFRIGDDLTDENLEPQGIARDRHDPSAARANSASIHGSTTASITR